MSPSFNNINITSWRAQTLIFQLPYHTFVGWWTKAMLLFRHFPPFVALFVLEEQQSCVRGGGGGYVQGVGGFVGI